MFTLGSLLWCRISFRGQIYDLSITCPRIEHTEIRNHVPLDSNSTNELDSGNLFLNFELTSILRGSRVLMSLSPDHTVSSGRVISSAASSTASLIMEIDAVSPPASAHEIEERTALLDVERGPEYGSQSSSLPKGEHIEFLSLFFSF